MNMQRPSLAAQWLVAMSLFGVNGAQLVAQELVPNGSFEEVDRAPNTFDQLVRARGWDAVTLGFPELFDPSATTRTVGIPLNAYGDMPAFDGDRYAGFVAWKDDKRSNFKAGADDPFRPGWSVYSEYLTVELTEPLVEGVEYVLGFRVCLAQQSDRAISGIGGFLGERKLSYPHRRFLSEKPQVSADGILAERGAWVEVSGPFIADGGEKHLTIGVFPAAEFDTRTIIEGADNQYAYYFIDAVSLKRR